MRKTEHALFEIFHMVHLWYMASLFKKVKRQQQQSLKIIRTFYCLLFKHVNWNFKTQKQIYKICLLSSVQCDLLLCYNPFIFFLQAL